MPESTKTEFAKLTVRVDDHSRFVAEAKARGIPLVNLLPAMLKTWESVPEARRDRAVKEAAADRMKNAPALA